MRPKSATHKMNTPPYRECMWASTSGHSGPLMHRRFKVHHPCIVPHQIADASEQNDTHRAAAPNVCKGLQGERTCLVVGVGVGRGHQRYGRARRRNDTSDDRDSDAVQSTLRFLVAVAVGLVVEVGEVHGVIDRQSHTHHDEDPRDCDRAPEGSFRTWEHKLSRRPAAGVGMRAVDVRGGNAAHWR